jgi:hypothetical protein
MRGRDIYLRVVFSCGVVSSAMLGSSHISYILCIIYLKNNFLNYSDTIRQHKCSSIHPREAYRTIFEFHTLSKLDICELMRVEILLSFLVQEIAEIVIDCVCHFIVYFPV